MLRGTQRQVHFSSLYYRHAGTNPAFDNRPRTCCLFKNPVLLTYNDNTDGLQSQISDMSYRNAFVAYLIYSRPCYLCVWFASFYLVGVSYRDCVERVFIRWRRFLMDGEAIHIASIRVIAFEKHSSLVWYCPVVKNEKISSEVCRYMRKQMLVLTSSTYVNPNFPHIRMNAYVHVYIV